MSTTLEAWLLAAALHFAPPEKLPQFDGHRETTDESRARYASIANNLALAVDGRKFAKSDAALLLAWGIGETGLARDADVGPCYRGGAYRSRCDGGLAATIFQFHAHTSRESGEWLTVEDLFADRKRASRLALRGLMGSWTACSKLPTEDRFSQFGLGRCVEGNKSVRARYALWMRVRAWEPKP